VNYLKEWLKKNPVDAIVSSGPPHSMHMIAKQLHSDTGIKWIADFRDPWTNIDFYDDLNLSGWADRRHRKMEQHVLQEADVVLSVGPTMNEQFIEMMHGYGDRNQDAKFKVIANGYDEDDVFKGEVERDDRFSISHIGTMSNARNPEVLWRAIQKLSKEDSAFAKTIEIRLIGKVDSSVSESVRAHGLNDVLKLVPYLPHHEVVKWQKQSSLLLLVLNNTRTAKGILTGKFFEYMSAQRPVLAVGPADGDAAAILRQTQAGTIADYADDELMYNQLKSYWNQFQAGKLEVKASGVEQYSRKELTRQLAEVLNGL
jgi:glycosyltransferase involved in cell wall biosynthesis